MTEQPLKDVTFVVTDTETTGLKAGQNRITEIAAVKVKNGEIIDRFSSLINPEVHIPKMITRLTGITDEMVAGAPLAEVVMPAFMEFLGQDVLVAHNLTFDKKMIQAELDRAGQRPMENTGICSLRLARRHLPNLPSKALHALASYYKIRIINRHRAGGDAEATAQILIKLLKSLKADPGIETLEALSAFQYLSYRKTRKEPNSVIHIREKILPNIPEVPGIYIMRNNAGNIIYIGKARRLNKRVPNYFTAIANKEPRHRKLARTVRHIEWQTTTSELEALLLESKMIKRHKPHYNRALLRYKNVGFVKLETNPPAPKVSWSVVVQQDGAEYFGPLAGRGQAEQVVALIDKLFSLRVCGDTAYAAGEACIYAQMDRCLAGCEDPELDYSAEVDRVRAFLQGEDQVGVLDLIKKAMLKASETQNYEEAKWYRDQYEFVERLLAGRQAIAAEVYQHNTILIHDGIRPKTKILAFIRHGVLHQTELVRSEKLHSKNRSEFDKKLRNLIDEIYFDKKVIPPAVYKREKTEELRILAHWMYTHRGKFHQVRLKKGRGVTRLTNQVLKVLNGIN